MPNETDAATAGAAAGTGEGPAAGDGAGIDQGQGTAAAGAQQDQRTPEQRLADKEAENAALKGQVADADARTQSAIAEGGRETERRVTQAIKTREGKEKTQVREAEVARLEEESRNTEEPERLAQIVARLATLNRELAEEPRRAQEEDESVSAALRQGAGVAFNYRVDRLQPTPTEEQEYIRLFNAGQYADLDRVLSEAELKKAGVAPAVPTTVAELQRENADLRKKAGVATEQEQIAAARGGGGGGGPDTTEGSGGGGGGKGWRTRTEARALHVQNKITSSEMRRINADPTIPEA